MLSLVSLKKAIVRNIKSINPIVGDSIAGFSNLSDKKYKVIAQEIRSGFDKPAFFIQIMPISNDTNINMQERVITVNIHYFSNDKTDIDILKMIDKLDTVFVNRLDVEDRSLTIYDKRQDIEDNVLQYKFDLRFTERVESISHNEDYEYMKELYIKEE